VLEAHKDQAKEVVRFAEAAAAELSAKIPPDKSINVLTSVIENCDGSMLVAALKMVTKLVERLSPRDVEHYLQALAPVVVKKYEHEDSSIRKASVLCLVGLHNAVGQDVLLPYLSGLRAEKIKLLMVYINRQKSTSPVSTNS